MFVYIVRSLFKSQQIAKITNFCMILPPVLKCVPVHVHICCLRVNMVGCYLDFSACCKC